MARVGHYVERWLELSAGFVDALITHSRHRAVVVSREKFVNLDSFDRRPRHRIHRVGGSARYRSAVNDAQLAGWLAAHRCNVVHVHFGYAVHDVLRVRGRRPVILSLHGNDVTAYHQDDPGRFTGVPAAVDAVIVPSRFLAEAAEQAGFDPTSLHVIPSGVDTEFFQPIPQPIGPPVVGFVGRFVAKKGIDDLLEAWKTVGARRPDATLQLLGFGPLQNLIPTNRADVIRIAPDPARRREQVRDLIAGSTVVVAPSKTAPDGDSESLLLVNLEAAASGRPVVSTRHGGIPEYVEDGVSGLLVPEGSAADLASAILRVLDNRELAMRLGAQAAERVAVLDVRRCTSRVDDLYDAVARRRRDAK